MPPTLAQRPHNPVVSSSRTFTSKVRRCLTTTIETVLLLGIAALVLEFFLGMCGVGEQECQIPNKQLGWQNAPNKLVSYRREGWSHGYLNSIGYRDVEHTVAKTRDVFRIVLLGDSATEGMQVPFDKTTTFLLQKDLNALAERAGISRRFEVLNFGCSAYSTGQELLLYETFARKYSPDLVVLLYTQGDAGESIVQLASRTGAMPRPYFYLDPRGQLHEDDAILKMNEADLEQSWICRELLYHSRIYGVVSRLDFELSVNDLRYRALKKWLLKPFRRNRPSPNTVLEALLPQDATKVCAAIIERFYQDVQGDGARFVLALFPNYTRSNEFYKEASAFQKLSAEIGFPCLDLEQPFRQSTDPSELILKQHFSAQGHAFETAQLIKFIWPALARPRQENKSEQL